MNQSADNYFESDRDAVALLVDEDTDYLESIRKLIHGFGYTVHACDSYAEGIRQMESGAFDIIFVGQGSRNFEGRCVLECATAFDRRLPVVVVARHVEMGCYLEAMQLGAVDYISPGVLGAELAGVMRTHARHHLRRSGRAEPERSSGDTSSSRLIA